MAKHSTHGFTKGSSAVGYKAKRPYWIWAAMIKRCNNSNAKGYEYYGARGITVCARWLTFENFLADMGVPGPNLSIDRIDNNGNYEPGNCRWATATEQNRNSSNNLMLTLHGKTMCRTAWEKHLGLSSGAVWHRLNKGWTMEKALTTRNLKP